MRFSVEGVRNGQMATVDWDELHQKPATAGQEYSFRYFQQLNGNVMLPRDFTPQRVKVMLRGEGANVSQEIIEAERVRLGKPPEARIVVRAELGGEEVEEGVRVGSHVHRHDVVVPRVGELPDGGEVPVDVDAARDQAEARSNQQDRSRLRNRRHLLVRAGGQVQRAVLIRRVPHVRAARGDDEGAVLTAGELAAGVGSRLAQPARVEARLVERMSHFTDQTAHGIPWQARVGVPSM